jgi:hypothetical protein
MGMAKSQTPVQKRLVSGTGEGPGGGVRLPDATTFALHSLARLLAKQAARETTISDQASPNLPNAMDVGL